MSALLSEYLVIATSLLLLLLIFPTMSSPWLIVLLPALVLEKGLLLSRARRCRSLVLHRNHYVPLSSREEAKVIPYSRLRPAVVVQEKRHPRLLDAAPAALPSPPPPRSLLVQLITILCPPPLLLIM
jgi:hypothetical protein